MEYRPDPAILPTDPWSEVYLSTRDLTYQIPINFATHPGVSVTAACFGNGTYSAVATGKCISNLLAAQYRRFVLDFYWDASARRFSLCPVELPKSARTTTRVLPTASVVTAAQLSTGQLTRPTTHGARDPQQGIPTSLPAVNATANDTSTSTSTSTSIQIPMATVISSSGETLYSLGSYQCSQNLDIQDLSPLLLEYFRNTSDTINARLLWLEFNLHAASSADAPDDPAKAPPRSALPAGDELLGGVVNKTMRAYVYTPADLASDRSNLNESWYHGSSALFPEPGYYRMTSNVDGTVSTPDGWPTEYYVQITKVMRVLLGWGTIDPQMANYSFPSDNDMVFPKGHLSQSISIQADNTGQVTSGCFFDSSVTTVPNVDSSWALSFLDQNRPLTSLANNLTACGISPVLNETLENTSVDRNATSYIALSRAATWNWATGEPRNNFVPGFDDDYPQSEFRCALMDTSPAYRGRWRVEDCPTKYHAACRIDNQPYTWALSSTEVSFYDAPFACPDDCFFSAPRTGLENHYLSQAVLTSRDSINTAEKAKGVWVNFNSLDTATCWVTSGPNGTCPYYVDSRAQQSRQILVPTIGAIIVFVLTALTIFVKCNANRRNSRTKRRGDGGWDYEGVPS